MKQRESCKPQSGLEGKEESFRNSMVCKTRGDDPEPRKFDSRNPIYFLVKLDLDGDPLVRGSNHLTSRKLIFRFSGFHFSILSSSWDAEKQRCSALIKNNTFISIRTDVYFIQFVRKKFDAARNRYRVQIVQSFRDGKKVEKITAMSAPRPAAPS